MNNVKLIIDSPEKNSSLIYATGFSCLDPAIFLEINGKRIGWFPSTEFENAKNKSQLDLVKNLSLELEELKKDKKYLPFKSSLVIDILKNNEISVVTIPESFPALEYKNLMNNGFQLEIVEEPFFKERVVKKKYEMEYLRVNSKINSSVMRKVYEIIASSKITNDKKLKFEGEYLTSEFLQSFIIKTFIENDMFSEKVIVAHGNQGCYPHEYGSGIIKASESIIIDIFPKNRSNLYYTDMTRTFCKGKASDDLKKLYNAVLCVQEIALGNVSSDKNGKTIHQIVVDYFNDKGFKTGVINGILQGFFHGTGHGVGLDCHEAPFISTNGTILENNSCVTVEPGLYYFGIGSVRIEDIVLVKEDGVENLTDYEKKLEIE